MKRPPGRAVNAQEIGVAVIIPENLHPGLPGRRNRNPDHHIAGSHPDHRPAVVREMVSIAVWNGVAGGRVAYTGYQRTHGSQWEDTRPGRDPRLDPDAMPPGMSISSAPCSTRPEKAALVVCTGCLCRERVSNGLQAMMGLVMAGQLIFFSFFTGAYAMMSILEEARKARWRACSPRPPTGP